MTINPNTVARAYRELEREGILVIRQGSGVYVADTGSPLARRERQRILLERIDMLLAEARQMKVDLDSLVALVRQRGSHLKEPSK